MKKSWEKWKKFSEKVGDSQANIIFSILYYLLMAPVGLTIGLFTDFLHLMGKPEWHHIDDIVGSLEKMKEQ